RAGGDGLAGVRVGAAEPGLPGHRRGVRHGRRPCRPRLGAGHRARPRPALANLDADRRRLRPRRAADPTAAAHPPGHRLHAGPRPRDPPGGRRMTAPATTREVRGLALLRNLPQLIVDPLAAIGPVTDLTEYHFAGRSTV